MATSKSVANSWEGRHAALHGLLRAQQDALREQRRSLRETTPLENVVVADDEERASQEFEVGLDIALLEMRSLQVREIEDALRLLEAGDYGRCVDCGEPILPSRLLARPFAVRCRACQEALEEGLRAPRPTAGLTPTSSPWALLAPAPWPGSRNDAPAPRPRRRHRESAAPLGRPLAPGGVSL